MVPDRLSRTSVRNFYCKSLIFIVRVHVLLSLSMYTYCCLCILIFVYVYLLLSMYTYCCLCILIVVYVFLDAANLTEGFPCFSLRCKANARV